MGTTRLPLEAIVVVGAGPAGLSAAAALLDRNIRARVIDAGQDLQYRNRRDHPRLAEGVGGAGLFSDGKFSFYPSATNLWNLPDQSALNLSASWFDSLMCDLLPGANAQSSVAQSYRSPSVPGGTFFRKRYPSFYVSYSDRRRLIDSLALPLGDYISTDMSVQRIFYDESSAQYHLYLSGRRNESLLLPALAIIIASGRFGPLMLRRDQFAPLIYRRFEVGVRLEQPVRCSFVSEMDEIDPKLIIRDHNGRAEWRTFCCCRAGEVVYTNCNAIYSASGRADGEPTEFTNIGFNVRINDPSEAALLIPSLVRRIRSAGTVFSESLTSILDSSYRGPILGLFGEVLFSYLRDGLSILMTQHPSLLSCATTVYAPTLEGVGFYPKIDASLRLFGHRVWIAGDCTGIFRGLTAAMISGYYAGVQVAGGKSGYVQLG